MTIIVTMIRSQARWKVQRAQTECHPAALHITHARLGDGKYRDFFPKISDSFDTYPIFISVTKFIINDIIMYQSKLFCLLLLCLHYRYSQYCKKCVKVTF